MCLKEAGANSLRVVGKCHVERKFVTVLLACFITSTLVTVHSALQEACMAMHKVADPDDLMTASDAGRILGISVDMVRLLARGGELAFVSTISGVRLFRRADVDALVSRRERKRRSGTRSKR